MAAPAQLAFASAIFLSLVLAPLSAATRCLDDDAWGASSSAPESARACSSSMADPAESSEWGTSAMQTLIHVKRSQPQQDGDGSLPEQGRQEAETAGDASSVEARTPLGISAELLPGTYGATKMSMPALDVTTWALYRSVLLVAVIGVVGTLMLPVLLAMCWMRNANANLVSQERLRADWAVAFNMGAAMKDAESKERTASNGLIVHEAEPVMEAEEEPEPESASDAELAADAAADAAGNGDYNCNIDAASNSNDSN